MRTRPRSVSISQQWQTRRPVRPLLRPSNKAPPRGQSVPQLRWWIRIAGLLRRRANAVRGLPLRQREKKGGAPHRRSAFKSREAGSAAAITSVAALHLAAEQGAGGGAEQG